MVTQAKVMLEHGVIHLDVVVKLLKEFWSLYLKVSYADEDEEWCTISEQTRLAAQALWNELPYPLTANKICPFLVNRVRPSDLNDLLVKGLIIYRDIRGRKNLENHSSFMADNP